MKRCAIFFIALLILIGTIGCERKKPQHARPFDAKTDTVVPTIRVTVNPDLASDQKKIAKSSSDWRKSTSEGASATTGSPSAESNSTSHKKSTGLGFGSILKKIMPGKK